ncbi:putative membrane protein [Methanocella conradii HZ254]|uniref:Membrane protein n=1 Tax=Methanocella conradii (strain DSM 24694 / JCM 17849 / CGMCC 1.5162 / HZ254) TaxID=1041930 RepID=H8I4I7_METCZ|nr:putative membrane protein [Methanocella conradii HZ254]
MGEIDISPGDFIVDMALDLKLVIGFVIITLAFIYIPVLNETIVRAALGLAMVLFVPGYSLIAVLFPGKKDIDGIERAALSFGLSIAVAPLIGLGLNFTPWGIRLDPIVVCLTIFTIACCLVANKRRHELDEEDRFTVDFARAYEEIKSEAFDDKTPLDRALTIILIISILLSICTLAYVIMVPKQGEKFTEFYILGPEGKADNYPTRYVLGDRRPVIVGVVNHEYRNVTYDLLISLNDSVSVTNLYSERLALGDNQTWEKKIEVKPDHVGTNMKMEFLLYIDGNMTAPYRECHLWVNVTEPLR